MQSCAQRMFISKVLTAAFFHDQSLAQSSQSSPASTVWFVKVVCTLCVQHIHSLSFLETDYFREHLTPSVAFQVVHHLSNRLKKPELAFSFFNCSRLSVNLVHLESTYNLLLRSLCQVGSHDSAKLVYDYMTVDGFFLTSSVLDFVVSSFVKAGKFRIAEEILIAQAEFCNEKEGVVRCSVFSNFLSMLINKKRIDQAVAFFRGHVLRLRSFRLDSRSFNIVMRGLCHVSKIDEAFEFFDIMSSFGCHPNLFTYNILINGLSKVGEMSRAEELLREVKVQSKFSPDVVTYTSVISGYCKLGETDAATSLFDEMISNRIRPNTFTFNAIIDGFGKKGDMASASKMYERMIASGFHPNIVTFTSLIDGHCRSGDLRQAMNLWDEMIGKKVSPNIFTFSALINALCKANRLKEAGDLLNQLKGREDIVPEPHLYTPVIDGFCKAGNLDEANAIVLEMKARGCIPNKFTLTILILGHCAKGRTSEAIEIYHKMPSMGCKPDDITTRSLISCLRKAGMAHAANDIERKALQSGLPGLS